MKGNSKKGFTITELVIATTLVAVIIFISPFIKINYEKHNFYEQFRKSLTTINLALNMSVTENGELKKWDLFNGDTKQILNTYFKPYFTNSAFVSCSSFNKKVVRSLNDITKIKGCEIYGSSSEIPKGIIKIDRRITFGLYSVDIKKKQVVVTIDVNGFEAPNIIGRDIFNFKINNSIYEPYVDSGVLNQNCSPDLLPRTGVIQGFGCADRLMNEGMMSY